MRFILFAWIGCLSAVSLSGCATITRGSTEDVQFLSNPPGATVKTSLGPSCVTPCTLKFDRRDTFDAVFTLGDQERTISVGTEVAGAGVAGVAGNVLAGGVIGIGVDVATGAGLNHVPNPVNATFETVEAAQVPGLAVEPDAEAATEPDVEPTVAPPAGPAMVEKDGFRWEAPPVGY